MVIYIEREKLKLLAEKPFYGCLLAEVRIIEDSKHCPTLGVNITDRLNLYINPEFWGKQSFKERLALLEHELLHLINGHPARSKGRIHLAWNIATDTAINQYIKDLPKGALQCPSNLEVHRESEYYYEKLMQNAKVMKGGMPNGSGDHEKWNESEASAAMQKEVTKQALEKAKEKSGNQMGDVPDEVKESIDQAIAEHTIPWSSILRNLIAKYQKGKWFATWKRPNRRFADQKGYLRENEFRLLIGIDTSGSIDNELLEVFLNEVDFLKSFCKDVIVMECDSAIHKEYTLKRKANREVGGRGGTDFRPVFAKAAKYDPSLIVYFTDGQGEFPEVPPKIPTLWVYYNNTELAPFGKTIIQSRGGKKI